MQRHTEIPILNIQRSLRCVAGGRHFRLLIDLYEAGELTNAVNRIIEDMNHRFVLQTLTREFESSDLKLAARNLARTGNPGRRTDAILKADIRRVTDRLMEILDIRHAEDLRIGLTDACAMQIREYLQALDLIVPCSIEFNGTTGEHSERVLFSQPGMRHAQAQALVFALMDDPSFASVSAQNSFISSHSHVCRRVMALRPWRRRSAESAACWLKRCRAS